MGALAEFLDRSIGMDNPKFVGVLLDCRASRDLKNTIFMDLAKGGPNVATRRQMENRHESDHTNDSSEMLYFH